MHQHCRNIKICHSVTSFDTVVDTRNCDELAHDQTVRLAVFHHPGVSKAALSLNPPFLLGGCAGSMLRDCTWSAAAEKETSAPSAILAFGKPASLKWKNRRASRSAALQ